MSGTTVTINGSNFSTTLSDNSVTFNGIPATITAATENVLTVVVPEGAATGAIKVSSGIGQATSSSIFTVFAATSCNALSNNNSKYWYFGNQAAVVFESNGPVALTNSSMSQFEGVATMSDANGNLLFYTNGITIYNRNHQTMQNGDGLLSNSSNTQAAFVVPFPGNPNRYFVITPNSYYYSIVDMALDNGNGAVVADAKNILLTNEGSEKVAGLLAANQTDIWLITYGNSQSRFNTYKITSQGITETPVVSAFPVASGYFGYMKISPDGTKIATANFDQNFHLYDFDAATGIVSNQKIITFPSIGGFGSYGIEFSPNSNLIYLADHRGENRVFQFDITLETPELIANSRVALAANIQALGALQLGPDNKIYLARENSSFLGVINQPNVIGTACDYVADAVNLAGKTSSLGLPGFVASSLVKTEPYIHSFSPTSGNTGTTVTITGINFNTTPSNNFVKINGLEAIVTAASETSLTVTVPAAATTGNFSVEVGCGIVASTAVFTVTNLGIHEEKTNEIILHPNPSGGIFNVLSNGLSGTSEVVVSDVNGRLVYQGKSNLSENPAIDLHHIQSGMYILKIINNDATYTRKIVKN
ncbi:hypothetical protein FNO01nite_25970 [Flavobacterium noncentrifugens]|nr:hypothetical protein FNO01nite_25970 [Flavobacterium noncentrifugens]